MALQSESIECVAIKAVFSRDHLGALELAEFLHTIALGNTPTDRTAPEARFLMERHVGEHRYACHAFSAGRDHDIIEQELEDKRHGQGTGLD